MTVEQPGSLRSRTGTFTVRALLGMVASGIALTGVTGHAASDSAPASGVIEEFADVSMHANLPPDKRLLLAAEGQKKGQALSHYYLGLLRERSGDIEGALDAYESVVDDAPGELAVARRAARLAGQFGDGARGRAVLQKAFEHNQDRPEAYLHFSEYLSTYHDNQKEHIDRALKVMEQAKERFADNPEVYQRLVQLYLTAKDRTRAREVLTEALERPNKDPLYWLKIARIAIDIYPIQEGVEPILINKIYEKALELGKGNSDVETAVADFYGQSRQFDRARQLYEGIVRDRPEDLEAREKLAFVYDTLGDDEKMLQTLLELEQINPHRVETQRVIARIYRTREDWANSVKHWLKAFRLDTGKPEEYADVGRMLLYKVETEDHLKEAVALLERAQFHYPEHDTIGVLLGHAYNAASEYDKAFNTFKATETLLTQNDPNSRFLDHVFYFSYGAAAERSKRFDVAADLFRKSINMVPDDKPEEAADAYNYLGYMWLEQDTNIDEAGELIRMALNLEPNSGAYIDSLGWFHYKKADYPKALETLLKAEQLMKEEDKEDAVVSDHIGQTYFKLGHLKEAIRYLERAVELDPKEKEFQQRLEEYRKASPPANVVPLDFLDPSLPKPPAETKPEEPKPAAVPPTAA